MIKFVCADLWQGVGKLARRSHRKMAALAYVTTDSPVCFSAGDILIVDASDGAIMSGQTSARVLQEAYVRGAKIFSCPNLHAKVFLFDQVAVVGSANLSNSSQKVLIEAAVISDQPAIVSKARHLIEQLQRESKLLDEKELARLCALPVERSSVSRPRKPVIEDKPHRSWLVSVTPLDLHRYAHEEPEIKRGEQRARQKLADQRNQAEWIRFPLSNRSKFVQEAQEGDSVIQIWHEYKQEATAEVCEPIPILERVQEATAFRFFLEEPTDMENRALSWKTFRKKLADAGYSRTISLSTVCLLPESVLEALHATWDA